MNQWIRKLQNKRQKGKFQADHKQKKRYRILLGTLLAVDLCIATVWYYKKVDGMIPDHMYLFEDQTAKLNWNVPLSMKYSDAREVLAIQNEHAVKDRETFAWNRSVTVKAETVGSCQAELKLFVSIACSETALHAVLLQVLSRFHRENPAIRLRVSNQSAPEAIDALRSGLAELAVVTMPPAPLSAPLEATVLASFREVPVCSTAFPLDSGRTFTLREIAALPLIALRRGTSTFDLYESLFRRHGLSYAPDIEAATSTQLLPLVKNGLGIAFVPDVLLPAPGIERLHLREGLPERAVCLIRRTDRPRSVAAAALETMLLSLQNK